MPSALVDTNVLIDALRGSPRAKAYLALLAREAAPACSAITVGEIRAGMLPDEQVDTLLFLDSLEVLPVDKETALLGGALKDAARHQIELDDCLIAATAMRLSLPLVTRNVRHYQHSGLTVVPAEY